MAKLLKSGRTPEQQAEREARKAAKASMSASVQGPSLEEVDLTNSGESSKKRGRKEDDVKEENELEVDLEAPTPLSKAEARAAKKREKRGEPPKEKKAEKADKPKREKKSDEDEMEDGRAKAKREKSKGTVKQNSVWIGNLSFKTTQDALRGFFVRGLATLGADGGDDVITRINLPKKPGKGSFATENKGFAYVDFATEELQKLAVGLSEGMLEGRRVLIKLGDDHQPKPDARTPKPVGIKAEDRGIVKKQIHPESATLFVGNLPFDATEEGLRDLIESNAATLPSNSTSAAAASSSHSEAEAEGDVKEEPPVIGTRGGKNSGLRKVRLGAFEDTGRCKGFAFLDFLSPGHATAALSNRKNHFYSERRLTLQYASESATKRAGGGKKPPADGGRPAKRPRPSKTDDEPAAAAAEPTLTSKASKLAPAEESEYPAKRVKPAGDVRGKKWEATGRPRPGAALAMAKREKVGIVEGKGEKITFD